MAAHFQPVLPAYVPPPAPLETSDVYPPHEHSTVSLSARIRGMQQEREYGVGLGALGGGALGGGALGGEDRPGTIVPFSRYCYLFPVFPSPIAALPTPHSPLPTPLLGGKGGASTGGTIVPISWYHSFYFSSIITSRIRVDQI